MTDSSSIEKIVMRRVRLIRILALILSTAVFATLTFVVALWGIGKEVWVGRVFENMPHGDLLMQWNFWLSAFTSTNFAVQALTLLTLVCLIFLIREVARFLLTFFSSSRV